MKKFFLFLFFLFSISCKSDVFLLTNFKQPDPFVILTFHEDMVSVAILLEESKLNFQILHPEEPFTDNSFSLISLGVNFPVDKFLEIMSYIHNYYPGIRYVDLIYEDFDLKNSYTLWIANKTEIAINKNLKAWDKKDFQTLFNLKTKSEIHNFIQKKNQGISISKPTGQ